MVQARVKRFVKDGRTLNGLAFMVSIRPGDTVETEFGVMVDTIYKWHAEHGETCGEMIIGFITPEEHEESLLSYMMSLVQQEEGLRPLFIQLGRIDVTFMSRDGKGQKEFKFEVSA